MPISILPRAFLFGLAAAVAATLAPSSMAMPADSEAEVSDPHVSTNSGAATYSYPIETLPGRAGLQPSLTLEYNSHRERLRTAFGWGWDLSLGVISCSQRHGVPDYGSCPEYSLNGDRLVVDPATASLAVRRYHKFVEDFSRVQFDTAGNHWVVTRTDGTQLHFGTSSASRVHLQNDPSQPTAEWHLAQVIDTFGNTIDVSYEPHPGTEPEPAPVRSLGYRHPSMISYAGGARAVEFFYLDIDEPANFAGGVERKLNREIREIRVLAAGAPVRRYWFDRPDAETLTIQVFGADCSGEVGGCAGLPATTFSAGGPQQTSGSYSLNSDGRDTRIADVNGDGLQDKIEIDNGVPVVLLNDGTSFVVDTTWSGALSSVELYRADSTVSPAGSGGRICSATFSAHIPTSISAFEPNYVAPSYLNPVEHPIVHFVDVNGDGLADIVSSRDVGVLKDSDCQGGPAPNTQALFGPREVNVFRNTGSGWEKDPDLETGLPPFETHVQVSYVFPNRFGQTECEGIGLHHDCISHRDNAPAFADFNGDGLVDVMVVDVISQDASFPIVYGDHSAHQEGLEPTVESRVWIQDPDPANDRWVRASEFDLPVVVRDEIDDADSDPERVWEKPWFVHALPEFISDSDLCGGFTCGQALRTNPTGVAVIDLNQDGLADVFQSLGFYDLQNLDPNASPYPDTNDLQFRLEGALINRGHGDTASSAWCYVPGVGAGGAVPSLAGVDNCPEGHAGAADISNTGTLLLAAWHYASPQQVQSGSPGNCQPLAGCDQTIGGWGRSSVGFLIGTPGGPVHANTTSRVLNLNFPVAIDPEPEDVSDGLFQVADVYGYGVPSVLSTGSGSYPEMPAIDLPRVGLVSIDNGRGGGVTIEYARPAQQTSPALEALAQTHADTGPVPEWMSSHEMLRHGGPQVVAAVSVSARGATDSRTEYRYAHRRFCETDNADLGYRLVETRDADDSHSHAYFYQNHGRAGRMAKLSRFDGAGNELRRVEEDWDLPTGAIFGSIPDVHVGRLRERRASNMYGVLSGSTVTRTLTYGDEFAPGNPDYGYNFLQKSVTTRPTSSDSVVSTPWPVDVGSWIVSRPASIDVLDQRDPGAVVAHTEFTYTAEGARSTQNSWSGLRDGSEGSGTVVEKVWAYDSHGNVISEAVGGRLTEYCYDGGSQAWCPAHGGNSGTLRVATKDSAGGMQTVTWLSDLAKPSLVSSSYTDVPDRGFEYDAFGRLEREVVLEPAGGGEETVAEYAYLDAPADGFPRVERWSVSSKGLSESPDEVTVDDGWGGSWKTMAKTESGYAVTMTAVDSDGRSVRTSLPWPCSALPCSTALDDLPLQQFATPGRQTTKADALGRPIQVTTGDGLSAFHYGREEASIAGAASAAFDSVLASNGKGDLIRRLYDGERVVRVDECSNTVGPGTADLSSVPCDGGAGVATQYEYEVDGLISTIHDPRAVAPYTNPAHYLRYEYDAMRRIRAIEDPDGSVTENTYTLFGETETTTVEMPSGFATTSRTYDDLGRPTFIDRPAGEPDVSFAYLQNQLAVDSESTSSYAIDMAYDWRGRVEERQTVINGLSSHTFLFNYEYDSHNRVEEIEYPVQDTVLRYEYAGAFLKRVCQLPNSQAGPCTNTLATPWANDASYDALGRPEALDLPPGVQSYEYDTATLRLAEDNFVPSSATVGYTRSLHYQTYDPVGNLTRLEGTDSATPIHLGASYQYDNRNRLTRWDRIDDDDQATVTASFEYGYDDLGNMTKYGVAPGAATNQVFDDPARPHAIQRQLSADRKYEYDARGNLGVEKYLDDTVRRSFHFDSAGRLTSITTPSGSSYTAIYDASGARLYERFVVPGMVDKQWYRPDPLFELEASGTTTTATIRVQALGRELGYTRLESFTLRSGSVQSLFFGPWIDRVRPYEVALAWWGLLACSLLAGLAVFGRRPGSGCAVARHTVATAAVSLLAPFPVAAGGGGGGASGQRRWVLSDHLGSTTAILDESGVLEEATVLAPFGAVSQTAGAGASGPQTVYAGHRRQDELGLVFMQARWQNPETGGFLSVDPVVPDVFDPQSLNAYAYAQANPVSLVDPTGMAACTAEHPCDDGYQVSIFLAGTVITIWNPYSFSFDSSGGGPGIIPASGLSGQGPAGPSAGWSAKSAATLAAALALGSVGVAVSPSFVAAGLLAAIIVFAKGDHSSGEQQSEEGPSKRDQNVEESEAKGIPKDRLGPSGKPKIHSKRFATRKGARDAAQQAGKGDPIPHSPDGGRPHFHPADAAGKKIPGQHFEY